MADLTLNESLEVALSRPFNEDDLARLEPYRRRVRSLKWSTLIHVDVIDTLCDALRGPIFPHWLELVADISQSHNQQMVRNLMLCSSLRRLHLLTKQGREATLFIDVATKLCHNLTLFSLNARYLNPQESSVFEAVQSLLTSQASLELFLSKELLRCFLEPPLQSKTIIQLQIAYDSTFAAIFFPSYYNDKISGMDVPLMEQFSFIMPAHDFDIKAIVPPDSTRLLRSISLGFRVLNGALLSRCLPTLLTGCCIKNGGSFFLASKWSAVYRVSVV
ncbi:hypothetical protein FRC03_010074 [Tulasnella sp. 419]|nr:hypothetical protein FRC03_010074 [Tulasnella sp. 419]